MAYFLRRLPGKFGQIWLQNGVTTGVSDGTAGNAAAETVDGITYDPYQVFTQNTPAKVPLDPNTIPTVAITVGTGPPLPPALSYEINYLRGKIIITPALAALNDVSISNAATPLIYPMSDMMEWSWSFKRDKIETAAQMESMKKPAVTYSGWSASATAAYKNNDPTSGTGSAWWLQSGGNMPIGPTVFKFFPAKTISTEYWLGAGYIDLDLSVPKADLVTLKIAIEGWGPLIFKPS